MSTGSSDIRPFKKFQIRWAEKLGNPECPYLIRWTIIFFGYSIRLHHWLRSDDCRYFHDHSSNLLSIVLKGYYWNVKPAYPNSMANTDYENKHMAKDLQKYSTYFKNETYNYVEGLFNSWKNFFKPNQSIWYSKATDRHWLCIPKEGAWTLLLEGQPYHKWGFYVNGKKVRSLKYFHKFGIIQTSNYQ